MEELQVWAVWNHEWNLTRLSVKSLFLSSVHTDEPLNDLRNLGVGCRIGGLFVSALGYADDILLLAPCRSAMQQMLRVESFAGKNNLKLSTDKNRSK